TKGFFAHQKTCSELVSKCNPVVADAEKIDTLRVGYPSRPCELTESELNVPLITHRFLALATRINVFKNAAIDWGIQEVIDRIVEYLAIVCENTNGKERMNNCTIPVSVRFREIVFEQRVVDGHEHLRKIVDVSLSPSRVSVAKDLGSITPIVTCP